MATFDGVMRCLSGEDATDQIDVFSLGFDFSCVPSDMHRLHGGAYRAPRPNLMADVSELRSRDSVM